MIEEIIGYLYALPGIFFALSVHEFSHGFVASKLGDHTAKMCGRLTLNPIKHIDFFGLLAMLIVGVGWAKPVPVNTRYFKKMRRDIALTAFAGPISNILSAFFGTIIYYIILRLLFIKPDLLPYNAMQGIIYIMQNFIFVNVGLAVFNMIPIPPLDGSRILDAFLPAKALVAYHKYEREISIIMTVIVISGLVSPYIQTAVYSIVGVIDNIVRFIVRI